MRACCGRAAESHFPRRREVFHTLFAECFVAGRQLGRAVCFYFPLGRGVFPGRGERYGTRGGDGTGCRRRRRRRRRRRLGACEQRAAGLFVRVAQAALRRHHVPDALLQRLCLGEPSVSEAVPHEHPLGVRGPLHQHLEGAWHERRSEHDRMHNRLGGACRLGRERLQQFLLVPRRPQEPVALDAVEDGHERVGDRVLPLGGI